MIGLDTTVLVRYLMQDDPAQSPVASEVIERLTSEAPGYLSLPILLELVWVLERAYRLSKADTRQAIFALLRAEEFVVDQRDTIAVALSLCNEHNADLPDAIIHQLNVQAGCSETVTFDQGAVRAGMSLLATRSVG